jgi:hypothetical protein
MARDIVVRPRHIRPRVGHISPFAHVLVYLLLLGMITVDYILLAPSGCRCT